MDRFDEFKGKKRWEKYRWHMLKPWFWPAEIRWVLYHGSPLAMFSRLPGWWAIQPDMLIGIIRRPKPGMYLTWNRGIGIYLTRMMKQPKDIHLWVWPCLLRFRMKAAIQEFAPHPKSMLLGHVRINACHKLPWVCTCLCICMYNYIYILFMGQRVYVYMYVSIFFTSVQRLPSGSPSRVCWRSWVGGKGKA